VELFLATAGGFGAHAPIQHVAFGPAASRNADLLDMVPSPPPTLTAAVED
jgi:hypothetical protein